MANQELEARLATLEAEVKQLREEMRATQARPKKDWRRTIGAFTGDEGMQAILHDAMKLREEDRAATRDDQLPPGN